MDKKFLKIEKTIILLVDFNFIFTYAPLLLSYVYIANNFNST